MSVMRNNGMCYTLVMKMFVFIVRSSENFTLGQSLTHKIQWTR